MSKKGGRAKAKGRRTTLPETGDRPPREISRPEKAEVSFALFLLYACVLISGGAALIYEVVWARKLAQFIGITASAHTAVLTAFMAGLALGSYAIGTIADRILHPLRAYALLELGIGVYALATLFLFDWAESVYVAAAPVVGVSGWAADGFRFGLALILLFVPTFLMGGTLPLLVRGLSREGSSLSQLTSRLYGLNTLGATFGALLGGFVLLPVFGMTGTTCVSAGLALLAAIGVFVLGSRVEVGPAKIAGQRIESEPGVPVKADPPAASPSSGSRWILAGFALSGFAAMIYQLSWIRALTLVIGGSVYAFSTTVTTFLAGIALGSFAVNRFAGPYSRDRFMKIAGWLQSGIAVSAIAGLWLIDGLPDLFLKGYHSGLIENFTLYLGFVFLLCFSVMILPTFLLGAVFPLVATAWANETASVGRGIGTAYAANSVGTILGALAGGLLILPHLGIHGSTFLAAAASVAAGALFWLRIPRVGGRRPLAVIGGVVATVVLVSLLIPGWDKNVMTSGIFYHTKWFTEREDWQEAVRSRKLSYYKEGIDAVVCVTESDGERVLHINGKPDGSNGEDLSTQILLVQIPMLLHPAPGKVAVIGLGTGTTPAGAVAHRNLQNLDVIEISSEVVEASRFFEDINHRVLDDPRTALQVADARNFLLAGEQCYDVIVSEPSNPWISGVANLFTREFFSLAKSRLNAGGILSQWIHCYNMSAEDLRGIIRTYQSVFPHVTLWMPTRGDLILVGSEAPHALDFARVSAALGEERIREMMDSIDRGSFEQIASTYFLGNDELTAYAGDAPLNTDDRPRLEFSAPRYLYSATTDRNLAGILQFLDGRSVLPPVSGLIRSDQGSLVLPSMGMVIRPDQQAIGKVSAGLAITRQMEGNGSITTGTQHLLQWSEGRDLVSLAVSSSPRAWTAEDRHQILAASINGKIADQGEVELPLGARANWVAVTGASSHASVIGLAWSTRSADGQFRDHISLRQCASAPLTAVSLRESAFRFAGQFLPAK